MIVFWPFAAPASRSPRVRIEPVLPDLVETVAPAMPKMDFSHLLQNRSNVPADIVGIPNKFAHLLRRSTPRAGR